MIDQRDPVAPGLWIDAGGAPENYLEQIAKARAELVLVVDTVDFGGLPGDWRLLNVDDLDALAVSTHAGSLRILGDYLANRTGARMRVAGIQPAKVDLGIGLSHEVARSTKQLASKISRLLTRDPVTREVDNERVKGT